MRKIEIVSRINEFGKKVFSIRRKPIDKIAFTTPTVLSERQQEVVERTNAMIDRLNVNEEIPYDDFVQFITLDSAAHKFYGGTVVNKRNIMIAAFVLLLIIGIIIYVIATHDSEKFKNTSYDSEKSLK